MRLRPFYFEVLSGIRPQHYDRFQSVKLMANKEQPDRRSFAALLVEKSLLLDSQRDTILKQAVTKFDNNPFWNIPWFHHVVLMQKVKDLNARRWYMEQTLANGWSRNVLVM
jgi:hypothetical protein